MAAALYNSGDFRRRLEEAFGKVSRPILLQLEASSTQKDKVIGQSIPRRKGDDPANEDESFGEMIQRFKCRDVVVEGPSDDWNVQHLPHPSQRTPGDDVKRLEYIYNFVQTQPEVTREEFEELWVQLQNVSSRMDTAFRNDGRYCSSLERIRYKKYHMNTKRVSFTDPVIERHHNDSSDVRPTGGKYKEPRYKTVGYNTRRPQASLGQAVQRLRLYRLELSFLPKDFTNYEYIANTLRNVVRKSGILKRLNIDQGYLTEDLILIDTTHESIQLDDFCREVFESDCEVTTINWKTLKTGREAFSVLGARKSVKRTILCRLHSKATEANAKLVVEFLKYYVVECSIFFCFHGSDHKPSFNLENVKMEYNAQDTGIHVHAVKEFKSILDSFYKCLAVKIQIMKSLIKTNISLPERSNLVSELESLELDCTSFERDRDISESLAKRLRRLQDFGVIAFTAKRQKVVAYVLREYGVQETYRKLSIIQRSYPYLEWLTVDTGISMKGFLEPGDYITLQRNPSQVKGTLGIFGKQKDEKTVAVTGAHVVERNEDVYFRSPEGELLKLGSCIFSPRDPQNIYLTNVKDIGVIEVDKGKLEKIAIEKVGVKVDIFKEPNRTLHRRRVFKFGGTTQRTEGFIQDAQYHLIIGEGLTVMLIEEKEQSENVFAKEGDSGSIVFAKKGRHTYEAIGVVFGGKLTLPGVDEHICVAVRLDEAVEEFNKKIKDDLCIDKF